MSVLFFSVKILIYVSREIRFDSVWVCFWQLQTMFFLEIYYGYICALDYSFPNFNHHRVRNIHLLLLLKSFLHFKIFHRQSLWIQQAIRSNLNKILRKFKKQKKLLLKDSSLLSVTVCLLYHKNIHLNDWDWMMHFWILLIIILFDCLL